MNKSIPALHDYWAWMFWVHVESEQTIIPHYMKYWLDLLPLCVALLKVQLLKSLRWRERTFTNYYVAAGSRWKQLLSINKTSHIQALHYNEKCFSAAI